MDPHREPVFLCGPTASGKTALALSLARELDGEIVNGDAFQLYRGLETLTAAPTTAERSTAPHHLFSILDPAERCDAMRYRQLADVAIGEIQQRGKTPVIVGGSGLYLKFLTHGPSPLPAGDPTLRAELDALPLATLAERLTTLDPVEAARTNLLNRRYVTRALEICLLAGQPCSTLRDQWQAATRRAEARLRGLVIRRQRPDLHRRIDRRTAQMLENGAIEEVAALPAASDTFEKAIGHREIRALLVGEIDRASCLDLIAAATRQYAKRQETWFRREAWLRPLPWAPDADVPLAAALACLEPNNL